MSTIIALLAVILIVGAAGIYIYRAKKKGHVKCIGCPYAGTCSSGSCHGNDEPEKR